ncbi:MAG: hypothetical protein KDA71_18515, partial [Planctomycetales bacterium]|nr:hypothetical protein [Planctomycetales bacterium]
MFAVDVVVYAEDAKPADQTEKITYDDHVRPILREHCFSCHNQNQAKGGLAVDTFGKLMEGGSSGEVVFDGDLESSRLWALVSHAEEPYMPPNQDRIADAKLEVLRKWIEGGLLENQGSKVSKKKRTNLAMAAPSGGAKPEGPAAMPEGVWKQPVVYTERPGAVTAIASSPWAPLVALAGQKQISLYHSETNELLGVMPFPEGIPYVLKFSRNGELLLAAGGRGGHSGYAALYDVRTGQRLVRVGDELDAVLAADVNDTHTMIAIGGPLRIVRVYSTETGELLHEIKKHTDWIYTVEFSPDGVLLATGDRANGLFVWEAETAREYLDLRGHTDAVCDVSWRPDSNVLASASKDGSVKLWEMVEGKQIKSWGAHGGGANSVAYTQDGRIVTAGEDKTVKTWDGNGAAQRTFGGFAEPAMKAVFSHDGKRVIGGDWLGQVRVWQSEDGAELGGLAANPPTLKMHAESTAAAATAAVAAAEKARADLAAAENVAKQKQA